MQFSLLKGTFFIDGFNAKITEGAVLQQRQGWEVPQIKNLNLTILEH